ncbi:hypothetical protein HOU00_gp401 [Caulobacter phage CcrPW]|uniref:DUF7831 domain-containing protein n=1 Tax=Caulobacter phage CcrPW TaxID=2283271 RepID=A0A385EA41_9CAUD|nr:hypothetical protein HOU00_gp401 [Caulobacter phage CcrPW]AXQ68724.1 hypothetical protein CcrPW_gp185c [Caulobacter phage CcrPW]
MPVLFQHHIVRRDLRRNADVLYVFGDNVARHGDGGQAAEMRNEPNGIGVATKYLPSMSEDAFFANDPAAVDAQNRIIDQDMKPLFDKVKQGGIVIIPAAGLGTERAELRTRSPETWNYLQDKISALLRTADMFDKEPKQ